MAEPGATTRPNQRSLGTASVLVLCLLLSLQPGTTQAAYLISRQPSPSPRLLPRSDDSDSASPSWRFDIAVAILLVLLGGIFAGLTIALVSQDETHLAILSATGEGSERRNASNVLWLLRKGKHWMLVTLLLCNVITNEMLPIVLDRDKGVSGAAAVVASTCLIVIFGEILPQAVCVRHGLSIGAWMSSVVMLLMALLSPVAWPAAKALDRVLGHDSRGAVYSKAGLKKLIQMHHAANRLSRDETVILSNTLDLADVAVVKAMRPIGEVFRVSADAYLDELLVEKIANSGHQNIIVHALGDRANVIGTLSVSNLVRYNPTLNLKKVQEFDLAATPSMEWSESCFDALKHLELHPADTIIISRPGKDALGIVNLPDIMRQLVGKESNAERQSLPGRDMIRPTMRHAPERKIRYHAYTGGMNEREERDSVVDIEPLLGAEQDTDCERGSDVG